VKERRRCVLFLIPTLRGGGAERVIVTLLRHLDRSRFRLVLAVVDTSGAVYLNDLPDDVEFIDLRCTRVRYALPKIAALIWKRRPDVVFSTLGHLNLALAMIRPLLPDHIHYIARETTLVSYGLRAYRFPQAWASLYHRFYKNLDLVVCQSRAMQADLVEHFAFPISKSAVIHNPVDVIRIRENAAKPVLYPIVRAETIKLIAAGRLSAEKGFDLLIESIALLNDPRIHLTLLGEGQKANELKQQAEERAVATQISFAGFQPNPYAWFAHADAFVLSSRYEGFPNVVLEALACGTPVIATPAPGGTREILMDKEGCAIAESVSPLALASAISQWIEGGRKRITPDAIASYTLEKIVAEYEQVLSQA
jgi:glycosyltransferase involved in cell wall biosynthesis